MKLIAILIALLSATTLVAQIPSELRETFELRSKEYPHLVASWKSRHFRNTTVFRDANDDPFASEEYRAALANYSGPALRKFNASDNFFLCSQNNVRFSQANMARGVEGWSLWKEVHACIDGDVLSLVRENASATYRPGLGELDCPGFVFETFALNYRPRSSQFFEYASKGAYKRVPGTTTWSGRKAIAFEQRASAILTYYFDAERANVYLGMSGNGPMAKGRIEVFSEVDELGRIVLKSITNTLIETKTGKLFNKEVCERFQFDFDRTPSKSELSIHLEPGTHVSRQIEGRWENLVYLGKDELVPLTQQTYDKLDPRVAATYRKEDLPK